MDSSNNAQGKGKIKIVDEQALHEQLMDEDSGDDVEFMGNVDEIEAFIPGGHQFNNEEVGHLDQQLPDIEADGIEMEQQEEDEIELASITIPMRRIAGAASIPGVELDSVTINMEGVVLAEGQSGYEIALEEARRSCPNHEPYHDHNPPPLQ